MSDLQEQLNRILSDPQALKQVQSLGKQLGLAGDTGAKEEKQLRKDTQSDNMLSTISQIAPLMKSFNDDDNTTRLLSALRPFLSDERKHKLDNAEKLMKLMKLLPLIKDSGLF